MPREQNVEYPVPQVVFRMFDYTDVPEGPIMPGAHAIERHLVEESLNRIIASHYKNRKEWLVKERVERGVNSCLSCLG